MKLEWILLALLLVAGRSPANDAASLMKLGDQHDIRFEPAKALDYYLPAEKLLPDNVELLVKIARQYVYRMDDFNSKSDKISTARTALEYAERAVRLAPDDCEAHLSVAICLGKLSQHQGNREKIEASKRIKDSAEKAVRLDPRNDLAWHLLGRWHQSLAGMGGLVRGIASVVYGGLPAASNEESVECFKKALALNPDRLIHHIEIGRTYAQMGMKGEARDAIEKGLGMANQEKDDPETKERGRATLKSLR